jgi:hypothetical protein
MQTYPKKQNMDKKKLIQDYIYLEYDAKNCKLFASINGITENITKRIFCANLNKTWAQDIETTIFSCLKKYT